MLLVCRLSAFNILPDLIDEDPDDGKDDADHQQRRRQENFEVEELG